MLVVPTFVSALKPPASVATAALLVVLSLSPRLLSACTNGAGLPGQISQFGSKTKSVQSGPKPVTKCFYFLLILIIFPLKKEAQSKNDFHERSCDRLYTLVICVQVTKQEVNLFLGVIYF